MKFLIISAALSLTACSPGDGRPAGADESRTYPLSAFDSVSGETGIVLVLRQGAFAVTARSEHGDLSRLHVDQRGSQVSISSDGMMTMGRQPTYTVTLVAPAWRAIEASAGVSVTGENLTVDDLEIDASSGVQVAIAGKCRTVTIRAASGAAVNASGLKCATAKVTAIAGAHVQAFASEHLSGKAQAGAVIDVTGSPQRIERDADISGIIDIR